MPMRRPAAALPAAALACAAALSACADRLAEDAVYARQALVGLPRADLLACAGAPDAAYAADGREVLTYESEAITGYPSTYGTFGVSRWGGNRFGTGIGFGVPLYGGTEIRRTACRATFVVEGGRVAEVNYADPQGGGGLGQCGRIVEACLARQPVPGGAGPAFAPLPEPEPLPVPPPLPPAGAPPAGPPAGPLGPASRVR
jgi:hypothetical protein